MVHEDIEDLKKFGKGIQHFSKSCSSQYLTPKKPYIHEHSLKKIKAALSNIIIIIGKNLLFSLSQCKDIVLLRISVYKEAGSDKNTSQTENNSTRKICRLREQRRQIGDTTIIIRKRIYHDLSNEPMVSNPSIYFFKKQNETQGPNDARDKRYRSVFDMPTESQKRACSMKERLYLFFLRW